MTVASVLGVGAHRVVVKVKRMGGGFGGKESRFGASDFSLSLVWAPDFSLSLSSDL